MLSVSSSYLSDSYSSMQNLYRQMSGGKRIAGAADDAAGLAVSSKLKVQTTGHNRQISNLTDEKSSIDTSEGSLSTLSSSLQRVRELSFQSLNGTYGSSERDAIQSEIDQIKDFIGSDKVAELGLKDYSVASGDFSLSDIDAAIQSVSSARANLGARSNAIGYESDYLSAAAGNSTAAMSRIEDLDYAKASTQLKSDQVMFQARIMLQKTAMSQDEALSDNLLNMLV